MTTSPSPSEINAVERSWRRWAAVLILGFVIISGALGFIALPSREPGSDLFTALCRALGIPGYEAVPSQAPIAVPAGPPASDVAWTGALRRELANASAQRGAVMVKDNCVACHGENGISTDKDQIPNLAAQSDEAIFKELRDFATDARASDLMAPLAKALSDGQMADVAAYYAAMPPVPLAVAVEGVPPEIVRLAREGDPARGIPGCDSCHGAAKSGPEGAPLLVGQPLPYIERQLKAFTTAARGNDLFQRMRTIASELTPDEINRLAIYYSGNPVPTYK